MIAVLIFLLLLSYDFFVALLIIGWNKLIASPPPLENRQNQMISVIVPARNEEHRIGNLLRSLAAQQYRNFELVVVDDHSTDETNRIVREFGLSNLRLFKNNGEGKKAAITQGVSQARSEWIVTTDADCEVSPGWLTGISTYLADESTKMLIGGVRMSNKPSFFAALQSLEFASLIGSGASALALGSPVMCNGANLVFRKSVFEEVEGYSGNTHIPSGDDEFLMRKVHARYPEGLKFLSISQTVVTTQPQATVSDFFHQRIRWAGKWQANSSVVASLLAVYIFTVQFSVVLAWVMLITQGTGRLIGIALILKAIIELIFFVPVCRFLQVRWHTVAFVILQIIYPLYVISVALTSLFSSYRWKGRTYQ
ncbi:MAG: glycosyltransferase [Bacteroidota bacterium]